MASYLCSNINLHTRGFFLVKLALAILSKGAAALNNMYSEALERIEGQRASYSRLAKNVLTWIIFAKRPLTTAEICCALAVGISSNQRRRMRWFIQAQMPNTSYNEVRDIRGHLHYQDGHYGTLCGM